MKPLMQEIYDSSDFFNKTAQVNPYSRKKYGNRKKVLDRGLLRPAVRQLARIWQTDYETAHRMVRESNADIHNKRQTAA